MEQEITLNKFPSNKIEALAMLYVKNQNLSGLTPEQIIDLYIETEAKISAHNREVRQKRAAAAPSWF